MTLARVLYNCIQKANSVVDYKSFIVRMRKQETTSQLQPASRCINTYCVTALVSRQEKHSLSFCTYITYVPLWLVLCSVFKNIKVKSSSRFYRRSRKLQNPNNCVEGLSAQSWFVFSNLVFFYSYSPPALTISVVTLSSTCAFQLLRNLIAFATSSYVGVCLLHHVGCSFSISWKYYFAESLFYHSAVRPVHFLSCFCVVTFSLPFSPFCRII